MILFVKKIKKNLLIISCEGEIRIVLVFFSISQSHYSTPKDIRLNCAHYVLYERPNKNEISRICNELAVTKDQYIKATKKPHPFLCTDKPMKRVKRNFYENI